MAVKSVSFIMAPLTDRNVKTHVSSSSSSYLTQFILFCLLLAHVFFYLIVRVEYIK